MTSGTDNRTRLSPIWWCNSDALSAGVTGLAARSEGTNSGVIVPQRSGTRQWLKLR